MKIAENGQRLTIYIGERDMQGDITLCETIVLKARELNMAGATVIHGFMGYGSSCRLHSSLVTHFSNNLPLVIEIIDKPSKISLILPFLEEVLDEGLYTVEDVKAVWCKKG
ncbi:MAG TPA: DUF190 domain-containing protein [Bacteroidales bacterium]|nr:DUF190 domain-containing protein [Bacteroidales bacterium]HPT01329.1 DUF190 domain-containing protein [Bacteroidales bacterium]